MSDRTPTTCDQCGQTDDHPKVVSLVATKHHDCLSVGEERVLRDTSDIAGQVIDAAKSGTHGDDLLTFIHDVHPEES